MAEACVGKANKTTDVQEKPEEIIDVNASTTNVQAENTRSNDIAIENSYAGKKFFKIVCVGQYSQAWSKGHVYIEDYCCSMSSDETICENPYNKPAIGTNFSTKYLYDKWGEEIRIEIWNLADNERYFDMNKLHYGNSDGAMVFWGAKNQTMESALIYMNEIMQINPNIPAVLVVDNVCQTPANWIGEGLVMNSPEEMDRFCVEHGFLAWFEMLERAAGEKSVFGQAVSTLINEIISIKKTLAPCAPKKSATPKKPKIFTCV